MTLVISQGVEGVGVRGATDGDPAAPIPAGRDPSPARGDEWRATRPHHFDIWFARVDFIASAVCSKISI